METNGTNSTHASLVQANQDHFDEQAGKWDEDSEYVKVSLETFTTIMQHMGHFFSPSTQDDNHGTNVLNFGCGIGLLEAQLRFKVDSITGIDISSEMIARTNTKIKEENWNNVTALQIDIMNEMQSSVLPTQEFDMIISCYTFHHLQDEIAIGQELLKYLKPGGCFCIIDFLMESNNVKLHQDPNHHPQVQEKHLILDDKLSEAAKASIGTQDGFSKKFLLEYFQTILRLENVTIDDAIPLKYDGMEYSTFIAFGQSKK